MFGVLVGVGPSAMRRIGCDVGLVAVAATVNGMITASATIKPINTLRNVFIEITSSPVRFQPERTVQFTLISYKTADEFWRKFLIELVERAAFVALIGPIGQRQNDLDALARLSVQTFEWEIPVGRSGCEFFIR